MYSCQFLKSLHIPNVFAHTIFQISAHRMACIQTPRTLGRLENISNVLDCYTEASMVGGKSYCRERTRNQSRFISFVPDMVAEVEEQEESLEAVVAVSYTHLTLPTKRIV